MFLDSVMDVFPGDIDRNSFGWYITGLTDGEGCFALLLGNHARRKQKRSTPSASFVINLRDDDREVLQLIQPSLFADKFARSVMGLRISGRLKNTSISLP